jgi:hypothetical protein
MKTLISACLVVFAASIWTPAVFGASGDLAIDSDSIAFSDMSPMEGDAVTISAVVRNQGDGNISEDIEVRFVEGDPGKGGLQIAYDAVVLGLKAGATGNVEVKWRAAPGRTKVYVIADPDNLIREAKEDNNTAVKSIKGRKWKGSKVTEKQINESIRKGLDWLRTQQGEFYVTCPNGHDNFVYAAMAYNRCVICGESLEGIEPTRAPDETMPGGWMAEIGPGMTSLALMTFLHAGVDESDPTVQKGIDHLFNHVPVKWEEWPDAYDHAAGILALTATGNKEKYKDQVEFSTRRLEALQTPDGGWGYGTQVPDAAHLQYVIMALYAAKQWGVEIKPDTWTKAAVWLTSMQQPDGGWNYYSDRSGPFAEDSYGSMTATAVMGLKAAGISTRNESVRRGIEWLEEHYSITRNPGSFYWHYYYLVALQRAMDIPPSREKLGRHDWYSEIASLLLSRQQADGSWLAATPIYTVGSISQPPTMVSWGRDRGDIMATAFAVLFLTRAMPESTSPDVSLGSAGKDTRAPITFSKTEPADGEQVTITASVSNAGAIPVENVQVRFYDGDPDGGGVAIGSAQTLPSLSGGETKESSIIWKAAGAGEHRIYAVVDPSNSIRESNEDNNIAYEKIKVGGESTPATPAMVKTGDGIYKLGKIDLDLSKKTITIYGNVNMSYGLIELLACTKIGKLHESALVMDVQPVHLQTALILLGLEHEGGLRYQGDPRTPKGDRVRIWVEWDGDDGKSRRHRAEDLVFNRVTGSHMKHTDWVFSGSRIDSNGVFMAQAIGTLITTFHDPDAIIDNPLPEGGDDTVYIVNAQIAPPKGTPIRMIITPAESS